MRGSQLSCLVAAGLVSDGDSADCAKCMKCVLQALLQRSLSRLRDRHHSSLGRYCLRAPLRCPHWMHVSVCVFYVRTSVRTKACPSAIDFRSLPAPRYPVAMPYDRVSQAYGRLVFGFRHRAAHCFGLLPYSRSPSATR